MRSAVPVWSSCLLHMQIKKYCTNLVAYSFWHHYRTNFVKTNSFSHYYDTGCHMGSDSQCLCGVCAGGGGNHPHIRTLWVCAMQKPSIFWPWQLLKTPLFLTRDAPKDPLLKNMQFFVQVLQSGQIEKTLVLKNICFCVIFSSKIPFFP